MNPRSDEFSSRDANQQSLPEFTSVPAAIGWHMRKRQWSQSDLARVLGWSNQALSDLINGRSRLRPNEALDLSHAFSGRAVDWLATQVRFDVAHEFQLEGVSQRLSDIASRARVEEKLPTRELIRRGTLPDADPSEIENAALELLEIDTFDDEIPFSASARRSDRDNIPSRQQLAWVAEARRKVAIELPKLAPNHALISLGESLSTTIRTQNDLRELPKRFAELGVALAFVPALSGSKIDGVCTIVNMHPLIAISGRGGRADKVMFTIAHELAHLTLGHLDMQSMFVSDGDSQSGASTDVREDQADLQAAEWLIADFDELRGRPITWSRIVDFADRRGISESLVIGRLQKEGLIPWNSQFNKRIPSVMETLMSW
jgi:HTH-type transcriptional regulator/antitoxin HigA